MAHFAQLNDNNIVINVIVIDNNELLDDNGQESETKGIAFCQLLYGRNTVWKQTSYNNNLRKNYAGLGYQYDEALDAFIAPKPFNSWTLDVNCRWQAPVPIPEDNLTGDPPKRYRWNEETLNWIQL